nr:PREDICTED: uncharacterized protein LOC106704902 [Latimeria chalumnae]|eukprot:XP_014348478.1 PREDICTED: uncharacterized protein LOC106704902 [Latimeria chalumnae]
MPFYSRKSPVVKRLVPEIINSRKSTMYFPHINRSFMMDLTYPLPVVGLYLNYPQREPYFNRNRYFDTNKTGKPTKSGGFFFLDEEIFESHHFRKIPKESFRAAGKYYVCDRFQLWQN